MNFFLKTISSLKSHRERILNTILALISISLSHYAGFVMGVPLQIVAASGGALAPGVTATFFFYVALCAVIAKVFVVILQPFFLLQFIVTDRAEHGYKLSNMSKRKKYVRSYNYSLNNEGYLWLILQVVFFLILMFALYIDFTLTWTTGLWVLGALISVVISGLFRAKFFLTLSWGLFMKRLRRSSSTQVNVASAAFVTIASALVVAALFMGSMRMNLLRNAQPQQLTTKYFAGYANLLASSGSSTFLLEKSDDNVRYIYAAPEYALAVESKQGVFPVLNKP